MERVLKLLLIVASSLSVSARDVDGWMEMGGASGRWEDALPACHAHHAALVLDSPATTRLRAAFLPAPLPKKPVVVGERVTELLGIFQKEKEAVLTIDWLGGNPPLENFSRAIHIGDGRVRSNCRAGITSITRTVICSREHDAVFIHMIADQPGALSFRTTLDAGPDGTVEIVDRRQLVLTSPSVLASRVWVLPFESDVATEGQSIVVKGEGEALIVWKSTRPVPPAGDISQTLAQLGKHYDPGHASPDPSKIWHGVLETHLKSAENSP